MTEKRCSKCGEIKPLEDFYRHPNGLGGRTNHCKPCKSELERLYRENNAEILRAKKLAYAAAHREEAASKSRAWYAANRERALASAKEYYEQNAEKLKARSREWTEANPERKREADKRWREENRERTREYARAYRKGALQAKPEKRAAIKAALFKRDGGLCGLCGEAVDLNDCHTDHILPVALGGKPELENLQLAHPRCNRSKGGRLS